MFSVFTLNLRFGLAKDEGQRSWDQRKDVFPNLLKNHQTDFIAFQEVNDFQAEFLKIILPEYHMIGARKPAPFFWQDNLIFYKKSWTCLKWEHFFLSPTPNIPSRFCKSLWPRQCTLGIFEQEDRQIICINTHFDFDDIVQEMSARLIMDQLNLLPHDIPVVLLGDFNAPPSAPCYKVFMHEDEKDRKKYFKSAFSPPFPATHHGFTGTLVGDHIDWILYRGLILPEKACVIQTPVNGIWPSDHFPLRADFNWLTKGAISFSVF